MNKNLLALTVIALTFNSCSSQTEASETEVVKHQVSISQVIDQPTWESKISSVENPQIIDVRTTAEFQEGHIEGAVNIDYYSPDFKTEMDIFDKERPVFIYCRSGGRSAKAAEILNSEGFEEIYDLNGGYMSWKD